MEIAHYFEDVDRAYRLLHGPALEEALLEIAARCKAEEGEDSPIYASMESELGGFYRGMLNLDASETHFLTALAIMERTLGRNSADYATTLNNLAGTHRMAGKLEQAASEFRTCMDIYRATLGESHVLYAAAVNNLSLVYLDSDELDKALPLQEEASAVLAGLPDKRDELAVSLCNLGALYLRQGALDKAERSLCRAVEIFRTEVGTDTPHYFPTVNTLGIVYLYRKSYAKAAECFRTAAESAKALYGEEHPQYKSVLENLAAAEQAMEN